MALIKGEEEMLDELFNQLPNLYIPGTVTKPTSFYFSLGEVKKTVLFTSDSCTIGDGKLSEKADCVCKTSPEFFIKIWEDGYRPGLKDFMAGTIKSNNPSALQEFLRSFGKDG